MYILSLISYLITGNLTLLSLTRTMAEFFLSFVRLFFIKKGIKTSEVRLFQTKIKYNNFFNFPFISQGQGRKRKPFIFKKSSLSL